MYESWCLDWVRWWKDGWGGNKVPDRTCSMVMLLRQPLYNIYVPLVWFCVWSWSQNRAHKVFTVLGRQSELSISLVVSSCSLDMHTVLSRHAEPGIKQALSVWAKWPIILISLHLHVGSGRWLLNIFAVCTASDPRSASLHSVKVNCPKLKLTTFLHISCRVSNCGGVNTLVFHQSLIQSNTATLKSPLAVVHCQMFSEETWTQYMQCVDIHSVIWLGNG